jgi:hypothetical protein
MAQLDTTTLRSAFSGIKGAIYTAVGQVPEAGKVHNRIRYAADVPTWLDLTKIERIAGVEVIRCAFVYYQDHTSNRAECKTRLYQVIYGIEVIHAFEDGTDEDSSTSRFEGFIADLSERIDRDEYLGFTDGTEVTHLGLQGGGGDGRPAVVDGIFAHRKVLTLTAQFKR